jgi:hypothetical protein
MLHGLTIEAEGLVWPLETFIDSHGFLRRLSVSECRDRFAGEVEVIDEQLTLRRFDEARHVDWHSIIAVKSAGSTRCIECLTYFDPEIAAIYACSVIRNEAGRILPHNSHTFVVNSYEAEFCEDCQSYGDWEY